MQKFLVASLITIISVSTGYSVKAQYHASLIGFYNLENFYDTVDNPIVDDEEFLPNSERHYNTTIFLDKVDRLTSVLAQLGTDVNPDGFALLGVSEIENDTVLTALIKHKSLQSRGLKFVHYDSPDYFTPLYSEPLFVQLPGGSKDSYSTRDILYVKGILDGDTIHVMVGHWPSRSGGEERSIPARAAAASVCKGVVDSLMAISKQTKVVIMGDLNDDPISPSLTKVLGATGSIKDLKDGGLYNPWYDFYKRGIGTIAYQDAWGLFDQVVISKGWLDKKQAGYFFQKATIFNREFLIQQTGRYKGYPKRTWDGTTYNYGYSDHLPVFLTMLKKVN